MKKMSVTAFLHNRKLKKLLFMMKLTMLLFLAGLMQVSATVYSQATKFSFRAENKQIVEVLREIEQSSNFRFFYIREQVDVERRISVNVQNETVEQILDEIFQHENISYKVMDDFLILLSPKENAKTAQPAHVFKQKSVSGKVADPEGQPLPGVTVIIKGTTQGTVTNSEGRFALSDIPADAILQFSFVGMRTMEIEVGNNITIDVTMVVDAIGIEEVVAVGYGVQKKSDITGAVVSVQNERLRERPSTNVLRSIQGAVAGVTITTTNARPDADPSIYIRGINSITASNTPLIVIDGIPGGSLSAINQNDIESIEILKDASASAIYGSRGSNGVILITTKRGKGKPQISFNVMSGVKQPIGKMDLLNGTNYLKARQQMYQIAGLPSEPADVLSVEQFENYQNGVETDWQDEYLTDAPFQQYHLGLSGKINKTSYYVALNHSNENHIVQNYNYKLTGLRFNFDQELKDWLHIGNSLQVNAKYQSGVTSSLKEAVRLAPWDALTDADGEYIMFPGERGFIKNPRMQENAIVNNRAFQIFNNLFAELQIPGVKGLKYKINFGVDIRNNKNNSYYGTNTPEGQNVNGLASLYSSLTQNWTLTNQVDYNLLAGEHSVNATGVYEVQEFNHENYEISAQNFPNDGALYNNIISAAEFYPPSSYAEKSRLVSAMGRINYAFKSKYLFTATVRHDGYSAFGEDHKYGLFPSFAAGWRISEEAFLQSVSVISNLKLRIAYGKNGNQAIQPYSSIAKLTTGTWSTKDDLPDPRTYLMNNEIVYGYYPANLANPNLGWETTKSFNIGIDYGLFTNRVSGAIEAYQANTEDLLLFRNLPGITGFDGIMSNIGKTKNMGLEFSVNSEIIHDRNGWNWEAGGNLAFNKNQIVELYGDGLDDIGNKWFIGEPIQVYYDYVFDGIVQEGEDMSGTAQPNAKPGEIKIKHFPVDGETTPAITPDDRRIIGKRTPDFSYGLYSTLKFRNFDLYVFLQGISGITKYNSLLEIGNDFAANPVNVEWWLPENQNNRYPGRIIGTNTTYWSSFAYQDASYLRIKDISLGYTLPNEVSQKLNLANMRIYLNLNNWITFTDWIGLDPETGDYSNPNTKSVMFGLNLSF